MLSKHPLGEFESSLHRKMLLQTCSKCNLSDGLKGVLTLKAFINASARNLRQDITGNYYNPFMIMHLIHLQLFFITKTKTIFILKLFSLNLHN